MSVTGVEMFYGDYQFKPAPLVDISREKYVTNNGTVLGGGYRVTLNGTLLPGTVQGSGLTGDDLAGAITLPKADGHRYDGQANAYNSFRAKDDLLYALNEDGKLFYVNFLGSGPMCSGTGMYSSDTVVSSIEFSSPDQWVKRVEYSVELFCRNELSVNSGGTTGILDGISGILQSQDQEYSVEMLAKPQQFGTGATPMWLQVAVSTSKQALPGLGASVSPPSVSLKTPIDNFITGIGFTGSFRGADTATLTQRTHTFDELNSTHSYNDVYTVKDCSGDFKGLGVPTGNVIDTFTVDVESSLESAIVTVNIQGELKGIEPYYGTISLSGSGEPGPLKQAGNKMSTAIYEAQSYLDQAIYHTTGNSSDPDALPTNSFRSYDFKEKGTPLFSNRANTAYSGVGTPAVRLLPLNPEPLSKAIGYNNNEGIITYSLSYNNRPENCYSGALSETISITRGRPIPVHANLTILGRSLGPILQDIGTKSASTTECSIEAIVLPWTGFCTGDMFGNVEYYHTPTGFYDELVSAVESGIGDEFDTHFRTADSINWDPKTGRLGRTCAWIHTHCDT